MTPRTIMLRTVLTGAFTVALLSTTASPETSGCPANSREVSEKDTGGEIVVTCHCNPGFAKVDASCKPVKQAQKQLAKRHREALRGMDASLSALSNELLGEQYTSVKDNIGKTAVAIAAALALKDPRRFAQAGVAALVAVAYLVSESGEQMQMCTFPNSDARTACRNANNFKRLAESSLKQLEATFR